MSDVFLPFKRYLEFSGRSRRREFWLWNLLNILAVSMLLVLESMLGLGGVSVSEQTQAMETTISYRLNGGILSTFWLFVSIIPHFNVAARRLHDTARSAWWLAVLLLPILVFPMVLATSGPIRVDPSGSIVMTDQIVWFLIVIAMVASAIIAFLVVLCLKGTPGPNRFGPDPKA